MAPSASAESTCRICLNSDAVRPIEGPCRRMMLRVLAMPITVNDGLPNKICKRCHSAVKSAYKLKVLAEKSYRILVGRRSDPPDEFIVKREIDKLSPDSSPPDDSRFDSEFFDLGEEIKTEKSDCLISEHKVEVNLTEVKCEYDENKVDPGSDYGVDDVENGDKPKKASKYKPTVCHLCGKRVVNLKDHIKIHDANRGRVPCTGCSKTFSSYRSWKNHNNIHHSGKMYYCELCKAYFKSGYEHKRLKHSKLSFACTVCEKKFRTVTMLRCHMTTHSKEKPFACPDCGKAFRLKSICDIHRRSVHEKERSKICQYCSKAFFSLNHLSTHLRSHTKEKNFKCEECDKSFARKNELKAHKKRHTGIKDVKCGICDMAFYNKGALSTHMISHTKEKKHECKYCGVKFGRSDHRARHEKRAHANEMSSL